jgi:hypothetical protein
MREVMRWGSPPFGWPSGSQLTVYSKNKKRGVSPARPGRGNSQPRWLLRTWRNVYLEPDRILTAEAEGSVGGNYGDSASACDDLPVEGIGVMEREVERVGGIGADKRREA